MTEHGAKMKRVLTFAPIGALLVILLLVWLLRPHAPSTAPDRREIPSAKGGHEPSDVSDSAIGSVRPSLSLRLSIVDEDGKSPGPSRICIKQSDTPLTYADTDVDGNALVMLVTPLRKQAIVIYAARYVRGERLYWLSESREIDPEQKEDLRWQLRYIRLSEIDGVVIDEDGGRAKNVAVEVSFGYAGAMEDQVCAIFNALTEKSKPPIHFNLRSDEFGAFRLDHIPPDINLCFISGGSPALQGTHYAITTDLPFHGSPGMFYRAKSPGRYSVTITRYRLPRATVTVLDTSGLPIADAKVCYTFAQPNGAYFSAGPITDASGRAEIPLPLTYNQVPTSLEGQRHWVVAYKDGVGTGYCSGTFSRSSTVLSVQCSPAPSDQVVKGRVVDAQSGQPLKDVLLRIRCSVFGNNVVAERRTDSNGEFTVSGLRQPTTDWLSLPMLASGLKFVVQISDVKGEYSAQSGTGETELHPDKPATITLRKVRD